jgi:tRNA (guanine37-N1)-methyltransferase
MEPEAVLRAVEKAKKVAKGSKVKTIFFATDGVLFDEGMAKKFAKEKHIILIAGRYEGVDARVPKILRAQKVSMGPYVLTGGELPAATVIDAVARFVPGVLGTYESLERERVSSPDVYTRPEILAWKGKKYRVPKVLLSGDPKKIDAWKQSMAPIASITKRV